MPFGVLPSPGLLSTTCVSKVSAVGIHINEEKLKIAVSEEKEAVLASATKITYYLISTHHDLPKPK